MTTDHHIDIDNHKDLVQAVARLVAADSRTLEYDNRVGSYIYSAYAKLGEAADLLAEAHMYQQDEYKASHDVALCRSLGDCTHRGKRL